jgi:hypothetical protein
MSIVRALKPSLALSLVLLLPAVASARVDKQLNDRPSRTWFLRARIARKLTTAIERLDLPQGSLQTVLGKVAELVAAGGIKQIKAVERAGTVALAVEWGRPGLWSYVEAGKAHVSTSGPVVRAARRYQSGERYRFTRIDGQRLLEESHEGTFLHDGARKPIDRATYDRLLNQP